MKRSLDFSVIDDFLSEIDFQTIESLILSQEISWTSNGKDAWAKMDDGKVFTFLHYIQHEFEPRSPAAEKFLNIFGPLIEVHGNPLLARLIYTEKTNKTLFSDFHVDLDRPHHSVIWFYNDNNGYTDFDGVSVAAKRNRLLTFDSAPHRVATNTDDVPRIVAHFVFPKGNHETA